MRRWMLAALALAVLAPSASAASVPACVYGRWAFQLFGNDPWGNLRYYHRILVVTPGALRIEASSISLPDPPEVFCPTVTATTKATPRGLRIAARWPSCGLLGGKTWLKGVIRGTCDGAALAVRSQLADRAGWHKYRVARSGCGDGIVDRATEECDRGGPFGGIGSDGCEFLDGPCQANCRCE